MIVTKAQKRSNQPKVVHSQPSVDTATTSSDIGVSHEDIEVRAYYIYQKRGGANGYDTQDWAQAERLIGHR
jgi:DUF2934 family protein